jgi:hypothetical protein
VGAEDDVVAAERQGETRQAERLDTHQHVEAAAKPTMRQLVAIGDDDIETGANWEQGNAQMLCHLIADEVV